MSIDEEIHKSTQAVYLWLFDRTGVYVATVSMTMTVTAYSLLTLARGEFDFITMVGIALIGIQCMLHYKLQHAKHYEAFNARARAWYESRLRFYLLCFWLAVILGDVLQGSPLNFFSSVLMTFMFNYVWTCQIRKREPPERLVFASQGTL